MMAAQSTSILCQSVVTLFDTATEDESVSQRQGRWSRLCRQSSKQDKEEKGSDLGCRGRRSCDSLQCRRLGSKEAGHQSFVVVTVNRGTGQG